MTRKFLFVIAAAGLLGGCGGTGEKQWYKAGADYTVAEFQRDRVACEKSGQLDEECLRQRGWTPLSADKDKAPPPPAVTPRGSSTSSGGRY